MKMFRLLLSCAVLVLSFNLSSQEFGASADSRIAEIVAKVDVTSYKDYLVKLSVNESDKRGYDEEKQPYEGMVKARTAITDALTSSLGAANVSTQSFEARGFSGVNIIGVLPGGKQKAKQYVISAHYDSEQNPGADDDASGVAGVLEAARVLGQYKFDCTIIFVAFDYEEERKDEFAQGSFHYANKAQEAGDKILGMISMDMIAFREAGDDMMSLSRCDKKRNSKSDKLLKALTSSYKLHTSLSVQAITEEDGSDPVRFFDAGYSAVLVSEHYDDEGYPVNPYYHEDTDFYLDKSGKPQQYEGRDYIDFDYATEIVKGVVGWVAKEAKPAK